MNRLHRLCIAWGLIMLASASVVSAEGISTREDREALFEYLYQKTMEREAFSEIKNRRLRLNLKQTLRRFKDEIAGAKNDVELFYALVRMSNARKDRHLHVEEIGGGLQIKSVFEDQARKFGWPPGESLVTPIRLYVDYSDPKSPFLFVADVGKDVQIDASQKHPQVGDRLVAVNGIAFAQLAEQMRPYCPYSTEPNFWVMLATGIARVSKVWPPDFYQSQLQLELENAQHGRYSLSLDYVDEEAEIHWEGAWQPKYPGFKNVENRETFDLYRHESRQVLLLAWHGFREHLVKDMDYLVDLAEKEGWLDYDIIVDGTRSRGGSKGAYAIQRLTPKSFKTTFGNLRMSDVIPKFIEEKVAEYFQGSIVDAGVSETIDDGTWLVEWLTQDVLKGYRAGQQFSNRVPFKLAHAPKYSDGILKPAEKHFRGRLVCLFSPRGGSHLDQFAAIVRDNQLGYSIGMPTGGYSNTWEWEEEVKFPISQEPVCKFMWSIGHTVRPNGELLEGNPANVDEYIPVTRDNYTRYYNILISGALARLSEMRTSEDVQPKR